MRFYAYIHSYLYEVCRKSDHFIASLITSLVPRAGRFHLVPFRDEIVPLADLGLVVGAG